MPGQAEDPCRDIIVVGTSAGGVEALVALARTFPIELRASVFVVLHVPSNGTSVLPRILSRAGPLPAVHATDGEPIRRGRIYIAPPDQHLLLEEGRVRVQTGPRENGHRPSVDPLFRSAAFVYGTRVVGVVLTGSGDDGTAGLLAVKRHGGVAVVQDPESAFSPSMPRTALRFVAADHVLPLNRIGPLLAHLVQSCDEFEGNGSPVHREPQRSPLEGRDPLSEKSEPLVALDDRLDAEHLVPSADLSGFSCPDCGGRLWEAKEGGLLRFRCRVGHLYSAGSLMEGKNGALETALWSALNVLEENAALAHRLAEDARGRSHMLSAGRFEAKAQETLQHAARLREVLVSDLTLESRLLNGEDGEDEIHHTQGQAIAGMQER